MSIQQTNVLDEISREKKMVSDGRDRFLKRQEKLNSTSTQNNPHTLVSESLHRVSEELTKVFTKEADKENTKSTKVCLWYKDLKVPDLLKLSLKEILVYLNLSNYSAQF